MMTKTTIGKTLIPVFCLAALTAGCPPVGEDLAPMPTPENPDGVNAPQNPDPAQVPDEQKEDAPIAGVWKRITGDFLDFESFGFEIEFVDFEESGVMSMNFRDPQTNLLTCNSSLFAKVGDDSIFISQDSAQGEGINGSRLVFFDMDSDNSLALVDDIHGTVTTFERVAEIPENSRCGLLLEKARFGALPEPHYATGMAFDGIHLFYTDDDDNILPIDPDNGTMATPITFPTSPRFVHAAHGADFWCISYGSSATVATLRTRAGADVDTVTSAELGIEIFAEALAFDETEKVLYVFGDNESENRRNMLFKIDTESEPDVLLETVPYDGFFFEGMTFHNGNLFAVGGYPTQVVQIDPTTLKAVKTFTVPLEYAESVGLASVDGDLMILVEDYLTREDQAVIIRYEFE